MEQDSGCLVGTGNPFTLETNLDLVVAAATLLVACCYQQKLDSPASRGYCCDGIDGPYEELMMGSRNPRKSGHITCGDGFFQTLRSSLKDDLKCRFEVRATG